MGLEIPDSESNEKSLFPIVAIGASAGGLQSLESFLQELPQEFCFAVVFMQHLSPAHKSLMPELLRTKRPDLEFEEMTDGQTLQPGHIYLYPPDKDITIRHGSIQAYPRTDEQRRLPIDDFFISLSEDQAERMIAVIFSGAGTDGARGAQAIKAAGGTVLVQAPDTAEFPSMPLTAVGAGVVDGVMSPQDIVKRLLRICETGMPAELPGGHINLAEFEPIFQLIYDKTGHRFNHYKKNVVARRIRRRMNLHGISSTAAYLAMLAVKNAEAELLASDFLIGVTSFFRDRLAWNALETEVVKQLASRKKDSPIRIWVPGCATGEEAYSIAMMLQDALDLAGVKREIQIFASDVSERALETARAGTYPESVTADIPPDYARKFLSCSSDGLTVSVGGDVRQHMVFAKHDLISDPPFSRMDLIICRNLLIYFEPYAQDKCIALFHYALNDGGYLFLGGAESLGSNSAIFQPIGHNKHRIYRKVASKTAPKRTFSFPYTAQYTATYQSKAPAAAEQMPNAAELAQKALVKEFAPAAVAINQNYEILYYNGPANVYLIQPEGMPTQNLLDLLPENLRSRIRGAFYSVVHNDKPVSMRVNIPDDKGRKRQVTLHISKLTEDFFLITFREKGGPAKSEDVLPDISDLNETAMRQLESELCATREDLQSHIEQLESLSEELQSSNEEMETSREELQSLNEELLTVNAQLQTKIEEQDETNNDLINFLASTNIPTLFLDRRLRLKRFTPAMEKLISLLPADAGRSITDMSQRSLGPDLIAHANAVLGDPVPVKVEIQIGDTLYVRTTLPYRTSDNRIEGVVITYNDVTELKQTWEALHESEKLYRSLFDNMLNGLAYCKMVFEEDQPRDFIYLVVNDAFTTLTGLKDVAGKKVTEVIPGIRETDPRIFEIYGRVASSGNPERFETYIQALRMWFWISVYSPQKGYFVAVFDVITERKQAEEALTESKEKISQILNSTSEGIYGMDLNGNCTFCNPSGIRMLGYQTEDNLMGRNMHELIHHPPTSGLSRSKDECPIREALGKGLKIHRDKEILWRADGTSFHAEYWTHPIFKEGDLIGTVVTFIDITERVTLENQLVQAQKMEAVGQLAGGIAHDFNNLLTAITGHGYLLQSKIPEDDPRRADVEQILESADRAAEVTSSLLAFSRQEIMNIKPVNINELVRKFEKLLRRIIGEEIELRTYFAPEEIISMADSTRIEQVLMNLATNARDAMPRGGSLTIRTERTELLETSLPSLGPVVPGNYAVISVSDSGIGINQATLPKIFEPFFTTKEVGKGTGLGLAMAYGILKRHGGYINVETAPNMGTTFKIYLPVAGPTKEEIARPATVSHPEGGTETILIAEDDEKLRRLFGVILAKYGYQTIFASNGEEAIAKFVENNAKLDLVLMDMIMPKKSGIEAYVEIKKIRPDVKVIFLSGYTADRIDAKILNSDDMHLILKPVSPMDLLSKVREVLGK